MIRFLIYWCALTFASLFEVNSSLKKFLILRTFYLCLLVPLVSVSSLTELSSCFRKFGRKHSLPLFPSITHSIYVLLYFSSIGFRLLFINLFFSLPNLFSFALGFVDLSPPPQKGLSFISHYLIFLWSTHISYFYYSILLEFICCYFGS